MNAKAEKQTVPEKKGKKITLENRVQTLESKVDTLWTEIFYAKVGTVAKGLPPEERETLRGAVLVICDTLGLAYPKEPWSI